MARKRLTERFPFLLPLRRWQRKRCFYLKMYFDGCRYAAVRTKTPLEYTLFRANVAMRNERSGFPMEYQQNKVHNLRLAAEAMNGVVLHPSETFSFWRLARRADRHTPYKDGLVLVNGSVRPAYGGGLCMLSDLLYWCFLHTPLTVTERHGHAVEQFPAAEAERFPRGADATVSEGWCDLRARNDTDVLFRVAIDFSDTDLFVQIESDRPPAREYRVCNGAVMYINRGGKIYERAEVFREETDAVIKTMERRLLYANECEIAYPLPEGTPIRKE